MLGPSPGGSRVGASGFRDCRALTYFEELYRWRLVPLTLTRNAYIALNACELFFAFHCYF